MGVRGYACDLTTTLGGGCYGLLNIENEEVHVTVHSMMGMQFSEVLYSPSGPTLEG